MRPSIAVRAISVRWLSIAMVTFFGSHLGVSAQVAVDKRLYEAMEIGVGRSREDDLRADPAEVKSQRSKSGIGATETFGASPNNDRNPRRDRDFKPRPSPLAGAPLATRLVGNCQRGPASDRAQAARREISNPHRVQLIPQRLGLNREDRADRIEGKYIVVTASIDPLLHFLELAPMGTRGRILRNRVTSDRVLKDGKQQPSLTIVMPAARNHVVILLRRHRIRRFLTHYGRISTPRILDTSRSQPHAPHPGPSFV